MPSCLILLLVVTSSSRGVLFTIAVNTRTQADHIQLFLEYLFNASQVYECLISVPFNAAVATEFIQYYNDTLQFQSTLAYLKSPPPSYQQLPVDLMSGLSRIQDDVDNGRFANEYAFEAALQQLIYLAHDYHLNLAAGILAPFAFMAPFEIASVSLDGIELPKVYSSCRSIQGVQRARVTANSNLISSR